MGKLGFIISGWSIGMIGITLSGVGLYTSNSLLQWIGSAITTIGLIILTIPSIFKK